MLSAYTWAVWSTVAAVFFAYKYFVERDQRIESDTDYNELLSKVKQMINQTQNINEIDDILAEAEEKSKT